jgi:hypothetical protein
MKNAIKIELDLDQNRQAYVLIQNSAIQAVRLAGAKIVRISMPEETLGQLRTAVSFKQGTVGRSDRDLRLSVDFKFSIRRSGESQAASSDVLSIGCSFDALYWLRPDFEPTEEQISAFHASNAVFTCWPYFREFIQNTALRMHIPPPPIPFLLLTPKREEKHEQPPVGSATPSSGASKSGRKQTKKRV